MHVTSFVIALAITSIALVATAMIVWGHLQMPNLRDVPPSRWRMPAVSVIVAARDEERHLESAIRALLAQSYARYEVIVVDDRSTDRTSEILAALSRADARIHVVRVDALPAGWLGKNHALHVGAQHANGEILLFTDADVVMEPLAVSRAVRLMLLEQADHLAILPQILFPNWILAAIVSYGFMWGLAWTRPWKTRDPRSSASLGVGAFNLVRLEAYRGVGGHTRIAMRPDDDLMLGKLLKRSGYRQIVATGLGEIWIEWYRTFGELARGFRKNAFAVLQYSPLVALGLVVASVALAIWPFVAIALTTGTERALYGTAALVQTLAYALHAFRQRAKPWLALLYPLTALLTLSIIIAAVVRTLRRNGIEWRGTFYSLDELRANRL